MRIWCSQGPYQCQLFLTAFDASSQTTLLWFSIGSSWLPKCCAYSCISCMIRKSLWLKDVNYQLKKKDSSQPIYLQSSVSVPIAGQRSSIHSKTDRKLSELFKPLSDLNSKYTTKHKNLKIIDPPLSHYTLLLCLAKVSTTAEWVRLILFKFYVISQLIWKKQHIL